MTRTVLPAALVAAFAVAVAGLLFVGDASGAETLGTLADRIRGQTEATRAAVALAGDLWVPRIAGLGVGLSAGLLAGGVGAYLKWGGEP